MSNVIDLRRAVRVVTAEDVGAHSVHETVNILTSKAGDMANSLKEHTQITATQYNAQSPHIKNQIDTLIDSGGGRKNCRTIFISGYGGPS